MRRVLVPLLALTIATAGCSNMSNTQQRTLSGGAIGAASGAVITAVTGGCVWCGAAIGGAVGAGAGYVYDQVKKGNM
jgi:osmotically inducible lipoprotein OsmB